MDFTPNSKESQQDSGLESSEWVFESTPKTESTPGKKRKAPCCDGKRKKLTDLIESCPSTPQFSSTLNESLTKKFENINIEPTSYFTESDEHISKYFKNDCGFKLKSISSTPECKFKFQKVTPKKIVTYSGSNVAASPLKEQHDILYPSLKPLEAPKKPPSAQKSKEKPIYLHKSPSTHHSFNDVVSNDLIMSKIFSYLSDGDLFRVSMVSLKLRDALHRNFNAFVRYETYKSNHKINKENYRITPPSSPETSNWSLTGPPSPGSRNFREFVELGTKLNHNQSLIKCPKCSKPSVVEHNIGQCQEGQCGYIFCQKCSSFAYSPEEFVDKCHGSDLLIPRLPRHRVKFLDLSNSSLDFEDSFLYDRKHHSSGYFSSSDTTHPSISVKRNLSKSFGSGDDRSILKRGLFENTRYVKSNPRQEIKRRLSLVPVVPNDTFKGPAESIEPSSPPRPTTYTACSKQSKRNLKRLTK